MATKAAQADHADNATHADTASSATVSTATNAAQLGGVDAAAYQRSCANGAIKAAAHVSAVPVDNTFHVITNEGFSCTGAFEVQHNSAGIYTIRLPGSQLTGGIAVSTDPNKVDEARVRHEANHTFVIEFIQNGNLQKDDTPEFDVLFV